MPQICEMFKFAISIVLALKISLTMADHAEGHTCHMYDGQEFSIVCYQIYDIGALVDEFIEVSEFFFHRDNIFCIRKFLFYGNKYTFIVKYFILEEY